MTGTTRLDVLMVADARFAGGTSSALVADTEAFLGLGATVGLMLVRSAYLSDSRDRPNPRVMALFDRPGVVAVRPGGTVGAGVAFLHHPMVFFHGIEERARIDAERSVLVVHHAPFRGDGSLEYDPLMTGRRIRQTLGCRPLWAPISGLCRRQLARFAPLIRMTSEDWINVFDPADWAPNRPLLSGPGVVIGRHGRPDPLKWPATARDVAASLPTGPGRRIRVMGCQIEDLARLGADTRAWEIVPFGAEPVAGFLDSLDVFVYFHHPLWVETFGRTVAEALLMGRACVLDPALEPSFAGLAEFCRPAEVDDRIRRLAEDPGETRGRAAAGRQAALARYARDTVAGRWQRLRQDQGVATRNGAAGDAPLTTVRKLVGLYRRRWQAAHG